jgi:hypothetical protein
MSYDPEDLTQQLARHMLEFLALELDIGFMLTQVATTHRRLGHMEHFDASRWNAAKAAEAIRRYESRLPEDSDILERCSELEEAIAALIAAL